MARITVQSGCWEGRLIRKARKPYRCDYWFGLSSGGRCKAIIKAGDFYVDGEANDTAGGYGNDRYCICHVPEAEEALARTAA